MKEQLSSTSVWVKVPIAMISERSGFPNNAVINVRRGYINHVESLAGQQILVAPVRMLHAVLVRERSRAIR